MIWNNYEKELQEHYARSVQEIRETGKAAKDVIGESYEAFRADQIRKFKNLDTATPEEATLFDKRFGGVYTADQYILEKESRKILALEEDKGHYVDKPFAKRAIFNAAEVFHHCYKNGHEVPYFILSCPTKFDVQGLLDSQIGMFNKSVAAMLASKFKFFSACDHGRTSRKRYLIDDEMPFVVNPFNIYKESEFFGWLNKKCV